MRLLIDLQGAQSESRFRGIGRYSLSLTKAILVQLSADDSAEVMLNMGLPDAVMPLRDELAALSVDSFRPLELPGPVREIDPGNGPRARIAELIREAALCARAPDTCLVSSLFEGYVDDAVTSIGCFPRRVPTAVVLYDLIPLVRPDEYLPTPVVRSWYERKVESLKRADVLLAISRHTRDEAIGALDVDPGRVIDIGTGLSPGFGRQVLDPAARARLTQRYGITRPFVMYTGGVDPRKNLDRLIQAYALLAPSLRSRHQLVIVGRGPQHEIERLAALGQRKGLGSDDLLFAGYAPDADLVALYSSCELFVFPSLHEGFGLPALEAMACGAPTIGSDASSIPEVIGQRDALFDPKRLDDIAQKLTHALDDAGFRHALSKHGLERACQFTWEGVAARTLDALRALPPSVHPPVQSGRSRPKLAFVSPLPPCRTGIADYAETLLDCLAPHYHIELIKVQTEAVEARLPARFRIRSAEWFRSHWRDYDRVLYQFGNSPFHIEIYELAARVPGVAVMHDFFISDVLRWLQDVVGKQDAFESALQESHGLQGIAKRWAVGADEAVRTLPANLPTLRLAEKLIVHSRHAIDLAVQWYGERVRSHLVHVPFPRPLRQLPTREHARQRLRLPANTFVLCSFGMVAPTKMNAELLAAWLASDCSAMARGLLVFVGENHGGGYGAALTATIQQSDRRDQIRITGFVDTATYEDYLAAADAAVQLRSSSRGETSAAVFDVLSAGCPLIVNRHGSMAELDEKAVLALPDQCSVGDIAGAIDKLCSEADTAVALSKSARDLLVRAHSLDAVGRAFRDEIERNYRWLAFGCAQYARTELARQDALRAMHPAAQLAAAHAVASSIEPSLRRRRVFVDVTSTSASGRHTGIERVVREICREWIMADCLDGQIEPVRLDRNSGTYRLASNFGRALVGAATPGATSEAGIDVWPGDVFVGLDFVADRVPVLEQWFEAQRRRGMAIYFVVYDLLPLRMPQHFVESLPPVFKVWLSCICRIADGIFCISDSVRDDLLAWLREEAPVRSRPLRVASFPLGADLNPTALARGLPDDYALIMQAVRARPTFLMVGTVEPRKGHAQVIEALSALWTEGVDVGLLIVGKPGWLIEELNACIERHPELGRRLFWVKAGSDEFVEHAYRGCAALVAASFGEGFGLPLIEAARHGLPIVARDISVFREVACEGAFFFPDADASALADNLRKWLHMRSQASMPLPTAIRWSTWSESAAALANRIVDGSASVQWIATLGLRAGSRVTFDSDSVQWRGWSQPEASHRWSDGTRAAIVFQLAPDPGWRGEIVLRYSTLGRQRVKLLFNEKLLGEWVKNATDETWVVSIPTEAVRPGEENRLDLVLPDACTAGPSDTRRLAIALFWLEFSPVTLAERTPRDSAKGSSGQEFRNQL
jgi:glycosyltransferase involved in cell wall biosynthesis